MADISDLFGGQGVTRLIVRGGFLNTNAFGDVGNVGNVAVSACGALTANALTTVLALTGRGAVNWLGVWHANGSTKTLRARLTIDDVVVFDSTGASTSQINAGWRLIGSITAGGGAGQSAMPLFQSERFARNCTLQVASSITETDGVILGRNYSMHD
jgi:hypothetical protein